MVQGIVQALRLDRARRADALGLDYLGAGHSGRRRDRKEDLGLDAAARRCCPPFLSQHGAALPRPTGFIRDRATLVSNGVAPLLTWQQRGDPVVAARRGRGGRGGRGSGWSGAGLGAMIDVMAKGSDNGKPASRPAQKLAKYQAKRDFDKTPGRPADRTSATVPASSGSSSSGTGPAACTTTCVSRSTAYLPAGRCRTARPWIQR